MRILLTNDDGILAPGIGAIYSELIKLGDVFVAAPASSMSGASHSITFYEPLGCKEVRVGDKFTGYSVEGSPADCVKLAVMQLYDEPFDLVVSGINGGANAGINVYYSGTVAAAMEAAFLRIPAIAVSLAREEHMDYEKAAKIALPFIRKLIDIHTGGVININIPRLSYGEPKGVRVVPQAVGGFNEYYEVIDQHDGERVYQLSGGEPGKEDKVADSNSLISGYITITPLMADMTDHDRLESLKQDGLES